MTAGKYLDIKDIKGQNNKDDKLADAELVGLVRGGFLERFSEIIDRYQGKLFAYIYRLVGNREEAEDILQNVFLKVYKNINSYDSGRKFSSWIYRIAHNEAVNHIKRKYLKKFVSLEDISSSKDKLETSSSEDGPDNAWIRKETAQEVNSALADLPLKYKQVLLLRYFADKSYEEIGEILEKPVNTVGTLINRAKKKLSQEMSNQKMQYEKRKDKQ